MCPHQMFWLRNKKNKCLMHTLILEHIITSKSSSFKLLSLAFKNLVSMIVDMGAVMGL